MKKTLFLTISILSFFFLLASPVKAACGNLGEPCCGEKTDRFCSEENPYLSCKFGTYICCMTSGHKADSASDCCDGCLNNKGVCIVCPATPESSGGIDFKGLSGAIPSLKPIFQAGATSASKVGEIISTILPYVFVFAGLLLLFYLISGGFQMMTAAGNEKSLVQAKEKITNALIGFLILFISYWLVQILEAVLGIQIF